MKKAMTITYEYEGALYVNLTNRCDCACVFCLRHNGNDGSIYADDLWLEHEPSREEALESFFTWGDLTKYREIVFCGFGEPSYRMDDICWLIDQLRAKVPGLPPTRINTNGHANLINGRDVTPDLHGRMDTVSISLNGADEEEYLAVTRPQSGKAGWDAMLDFTRKAAAQVPHVVMTIVDKDKTPEDIIKCRALAESLGATLRVRAYIPD
ncbi:TatD family nuclease-associated radical SAM protein [Oscillibacter sp. MSJ-2]|uniref:TatD family nuclease-associated radical SAM protein n=1 Tax=Dysosmobacter acutus TaxID=2841504 RepID=A0ABS6F5Z7_9FIRM|nr:TatD family nuclease-associated radical SAM protein [Dysosmobacter acutus]MBU5625727.1 TatD family nuclease-associated radical SAM protein [Dysosmobacter acutus]